MDVNGQPWARIAPIAAKTLRIVGRQDMGKVQRLRPRQPVQPSGQQVMLRDIERYPWKQGTPLIWRAKI